MPEPRAAHAASSWFTLEVGAFIRGRIRREIEGEAWGRGLDITTDESKSLLVSVYRFTVRGPAATVTTFVDDIQRWAREIEANATR